jgi:hypothetical protein
MKITHASTLTDGALIAELSRLAGGERAATVALIVHLAEFDARRLYAGEGYSSTFRYCTDVLHLSEDAAFNRIEVARAGRAFPRVLDMLLSGALSPTTARLLARRLTEENHEDLLAAAAGRSQQQVEELLAQRFPQPDVPPSIRPLPAVLPPREAPFAGDVEPPRPGALTDLPAADGSASTEALRSTSAIAPRPLVRPLAADRYLVRFTASAETRDLLRRAQDLLGHAVPSGSLDEVFHRALSLLVHDLERKRFAATTHPRRSRGQSKDSRNIPAAVKRAVRERDGERCTWASPSGHPCEARRLLEFHHDDPYGVGGKSTVDRIRLLCRIHNDHEARLFYGPRRRYVGAGVVDQVGAGVVDESDGRTWPIASRLPVPGRVNDSLPAGLNERQGPG